jgi:hypothetical protein
VFVRQIEREKCDRSRLTRKPSKWNPGQNHFYDYPTYRPLEPNPLSAAQDGCHVSTKQIEGAGFETLCRPASPVIFAYQKHPEWLVTPRSGTPSDDTAVAFPLDKTDSQYLNRFKQGPGECPLKLPTYCCVSEN